MSLRNTLFSVATIAVLVLAAGLYSCTDRGGDQDVLQSEPPKVIDPFGFPDTPLGREIRQHMDLAVGVGKDAETRYQQSLTKLRAKPETVVPLILESYRRAPEDQRLARWVLTETLKELRSPAALAGLYDIAKTPIPNTPSPDGHHVFPQAEELVIRVTAIEGIGLVARQGNPSADKFLLSLRNHERLTVRRAAIRAYLAAGDTNSRRKELLALLPESEHPLVNLAVTDPKSVPYPPELLKQFKLPTGKPADAPSAPKQ